jgi:predicted exporter
MGYIIYSVDKMFAIIGLIVALGLGISYAIVTSMGGSVFLGGN